MYQLRSVAFVSSESAPTCERPFFFFSGLVPRARTYSMYNEIPVSVFRPIFVAPRAHSLRQVGGDRRRQTRRMWKLRFPALRAQAEVLQVESICVGDLD